MTRPTFLLRDLFWLVLVCAMAVGWWVTYRQVDSLRRKLANARRDAETFDELTAKLNAKGIAWTIFDKKGMAVWSTTDAPLPADADRGPMTAPRPQGAPPADVDGDPFGEEPTTPAAR